MPVTFVPELDRASAPLSAVLRTCIRESQSAAGSGDPDNSWLYAIPSISNTVWNRITFGSHSYPLRKTIEGRFTLDRENKWRLVIGELAPRYVGVGRTQIEAADDLAAQIHEDFQNLILKGDFQRSPDEKEKWQTLNSVVDVATYWKETPRRVYEHGQVVNKSRIWGSCAITIRWDDRREDTFEMRQVPDTFASLCVNDWVGVWVDRNRSTGNVDRVLVAEKLAAPVKLSDEQAADYAKQIKVTQTEGRPLY